MIGSQFEIIFVSHISDLKTLSPEYAKKFLKLNNNKTNTLINKQAKRFEKTSNQKSIKMIANRHI